MKTLRTILLYKIIIIFLLITLGITYIRIKKDNVNIINKNITIGIINSIKETEKNTEIELKENIIVIANNISENLNIGDIIKIEGPLKIPEKNSIFNLFNYQKYLKSKKIDYIIYTDKITKIKNNTNIKYKIKNGTQNHIEKYKTKAYLKTFILGQNMIEKSIKSSYQTNGISHLFAISGMHIELFAAIIMWILKKVKINEIINYLIIIVFLIFFAFLTNYTPSVLRTLIMYILLVVNKQFNLKIKTIYLLIITMEILLINNPYYIYNIGFLYSFTISAGLILSNCQEKNYWKNLLKTSIISFLVSIPISINNFNSINLISPILNIFFVPYVSFIIFPLALLTFIIRPLDNFLNYALLLLEYISILCEKFKIEIILSSIPWYIMLLYYLTIIIFIIGIKYKNKRYFIPLVIIIIFHANIKYLIKSLQITMLDVEQGDSILIELPHNNNILIDTGGNSNKQISIINTIPYLKSLGITKIDYLILSHGDFDHMGEAINLVNNFKVDNVIFNCGTYNDLEKELIKVLDKKKIKYYSCIKELSIDKYKLQFLNTKEYDNENDNSNVIYFNYEGSKFLFMGDAGVEKEKDILKKYNLKDIDFLKVGHHGSNTSSSEYFIDNINPKYSLISVGKNNRYGHPKEEVLDILKNSKIYRTDLDGSIEIKLNKNGYKIKTCPP